MRNNPVPYLCGGIFLVLLTAAKGKAASRRQLRSGKKDRVSNRNILEGLIQFLMPSFEQPTAGRTFEGDTTDYRACKVSYGVNLPFDDDVEIKAFDERVKTQYLTECRKMDEFIDNFLSDDSPEKMHMLIQRILTIIDKDQLIKPEALFYLSETPISKSDLLSLEHYCLSSLLLGVWHYIVMTRPDNEIGRDTFEALHERADEIGAKWKFKKRFGAKYTREFRYDLFSTAGHDDVENEDHGDETKKAPADEAEAEMMEAEVVEEAEPLETNTVIKEGRIYQQQAQKIYNIEHIENFYG